MSQITSTSPFRESDLSDEFWFEPFDRAVSR
jgi:hypothetical protein